MKVLRQWGRVPGEPWESRAVLLFEPRDCWVGLYWDKEHVYVTLLPCLPFRITRRKQVTACTT